MLKEKPRRYGERIQLHTYLKPADALKLREMAQRQDVAVAVLIRQGVLRLIEEAGL